ncbi:TIGR03936 family radical SAM-associated protein [Sporomusa sp. KB1]|jgi:radical SAM-linked protein|uniref:TIGR03936 family radical SAM-associated protein n=1 Tax=Sporomusa sp. KB1 TaxID=943346 RepID=UPI0011A48F6D|nr:TIGR03936 family radical SAM-associated protein [Sporomusa sp. KB1]TWH48225.1 radical SAM-linked protein [Sporomusa sp. KB1]
MAKLRLKITKGNPIRFVSHLDFAGTIERAVRRAKLPAAYSEGFNPHMKLAFASALAVGVTSEAEYLDLELTEAIDIALLEARLKPQLPAGIELKAAKYVEQHSKALMAVVNLAAYEIIGSLTPGKVWDAVETSIDNFNREVEVIYVKQSPKGRREIDIKEYLTEPVVVKPLPAKQPNLILNLAIKITPGGSVKPVEVLTVLTDNYGLPVDKDAALINRIGLFITNGKVWRSPIEL